MRKPRAEHFWTRQLGFWDVVKVGFVIALAVVAVRWYGPLPPLISVGRVTLRDVDEIDQGATSGQIAPSPDKEIIPSSTSFEKLPGEIATTKQQVAESPASVLPTVKIRTWKSVRGKTVEAEFQELRAGEVVLLSAKGERLGIKWESLSDADRLYVQQIDSKAMGKLRPNPLIIDRHNSSQASNDKRRESLGWFVRAQADENARREQFFGTAARKDANAAAALQQHSEKQQAYWDSWFARGRAGDVGVTAVFDFSDNAKGSASYDSRTGEGDYYASRPPTFDPWKSVRTGLIEEEGMELAKMRDAGKHVQDNYDGSIAKLAGMAAGFREQVRSNQARMEQNFRLAERTSDWFQKHAIWRENEALQTQIQVAQPQWYKTENSLIKEYIRNPDKVRKVMDILANSHDVHEFSREYCREFMNAR